MNIMLWLCWLHQAGRGHGQETLVPVIAESKPTACCGLSIFTHPWISSILISQAGPRLHKKRGAQLWLLPTPLCPCPVLKRGKRATGTPTVCVAYNTSGECTLAMLPWDQILFICFFVTLALSAGHGKNNIWETKFRKQTSYKRVFGN